MATKKTTKKGRQGARRQQTKQRSVQPAAGRLKVAGVVDANRFLSLRALAGGEPDSIQMVLVPAGRDRKRMDHLG